MAKGNNGPAAMVRCASPRPGVCCSFRPAKCRLMRSWPRHRAAGRALGSLCALLDVPADRGAGFGVFDSGGPDDDAAALAKSIKLAATKAYGTAGPEFVRRLISNGVTSDEVRRLIDQFVAATIPGAADGQVERAAQRFGLIFAAGELATDFGIVPWLAGAARDAAAWGLIAVD